MSYMPSSGPSHFDTELGLDIARDKIAREERYADGVNLLREQRRARGGGPLRRVRDRLRAARIR